MPNEPLINQPIAPQPKKGAGWLVLIVIILAVAVAFAVYYMSPNKPSPSGNGNKVNAPAVKETTANQPTDNAPPGLHPQETNAPKAPVGSNLSPGEMANINAGKVNKK